jgi:hypothetical protein
MARKSNGYHQDWQRCMGVEPTLGRANDRADGFEDREAHPGPYTSVRAYTPMSCGRRGEEARILCHAGPTLVNLLLWAGIPWLVAFTAIC